MSDRANLFELLRPDLGASATAETIRLSVPGPTASLHPRAPSRAGEFLRRYDRIFPGCPIELQWSFGPPAGAAWYVGDVGTSLRAAIYYDKPIPLTEPVRYERRLLFEDPAVPISAAGAVAPRLLAFTSPDDGFYLAGFKRLTLVCTTNGPSAGPFSAVTWIQVVLEDVALPLLGPPLLPPVGEGYMPPPQSFTHHLLWGEGPGDPGWNRPYQIRVRYRNAFACARVARVEWRLVEAQHNSKDAHELDVDADVRTVSGPLAPGQTQSLDLTVAAKQFFWMLGSPIYGTTASAHRKYFHYYGSVKIVDVYGNAYPEVVSGGPLVRVEVSAAKERWAAVAVIAAIVIVIVFLWWEIEIPADLNLAKGAYRQAMDPPAPDPHFLDDVPLDAPEIRIEHPDPIAQAALDLLQTMMRMATWDAQLSLIQGKWLGARMAGSAEGLALQGRAWEQVIGLQLDAAARIDDIARRVTGSADVDAVNARVCARLAEPPEGLSSERRHELLASGAIEADVDELDALLREPRLRALGLRCGGLPFDPMAEAARDLARLTHREMIELRDRAAGLATEDAPADLEQPAGEPVGPG